MNASLPSREDLDAVFLDAGNTLMSMDFDRLAVELAELGQPVAPSRLSRAEAAARPVVSQAVAQGQSTEGRDRFRFYLHCTLERCLALAPDELDDVTERLAARVHRPGESDRLWSAVLPGVPEALDRLNRAGLRLLVVSNSDGTIERGLERAGLRPYLDGVVDSQVVGFEKPDPRIFEHALARADTKAERALHVGDLYSADVLGARSAGLHAVLLDPHEDWTEVDCPRVADVPTLARVLLGG